MSEVNETQAGLIKMRSRLAEIDPTMADWDIDDPESAEVLLIVGAIILGGAEVTIGDDSDPESIQISSLGKDADGNPVLAISVTSKDGTVSDDAAELMSSLAAANLDAELEAFNG